MIYVAFDVNRALQMYDVSVKFCRGVTRKQLGVQGKKIKCHHQQQQKKESIQYIFIFQAFGKKSRKKVQSTHLVG